MPNFVFPISNLEFWIQILGHLAFRFACTFIQVDLSRIYQTYGQKKENIYILNRTISHKPIDKKDARE